MSLVTVAVLTGLPQPIPEIAVIGAIKSQEGISPEILVYNHPEQSIGTARQECVKLATGELIAFIDSDCLLPNDEWLLEMCIPFSLDKNVVMTWTLGKYNPLDTSINRYAILSNPYNPKMVPGTGHCVIRRQAILDAGGFRDLPAGEDIDLVKRLKGEVRYVPMNEVYHYHSMTVGQFLRKHWRNVTSGVPGGNTRILPVLWNLSIIGPFCEGLVNGFMDEPAWFWHCILGWITAWMGVVGMVVKR